jgi:6-phosphogluconolactonase
MAAVDSNFFATADELVRAVTCAWLDEIDAARRAGKPHCVALSGGRIAQRFFATVAEREARHAGGPTMSRPDVHFFWADERCVPPTDAESNFRMADELLFRPLGIAPDQIHRIHGEAPPGSAAELAEAELRRVVPVDGAGQPVLDLVFLGMGEDGHVASLFPGERRSLVASPAVYRAITGSPKPPPNRVTLGFPAIVAARNVWVLASGGGKKRALDEALSPAGRNPLAQVLQARRQTRIFSDIR